MRATTACARWRWRCRGASTFCHHELTDHLASRARIRKSHVISFLEGTHGLIERLTTDPVGLRVLTPDEILSMAESDNAIILRGWSATSLLKDVPHAVRI